MGGSLSERVRVIAGHCIRHITRPFLVSSNQAMNDNVVDEMREMCDNIDKSTIFFFVAGSSKKIFYGDRNLVDLISDDSCHIWLNCSISRDPNLRRDLISRNRVSSLIYYWRNWAFSLIALAHRAFSIGSQCANDDSYVWTFTPISITVSPW